MARLGELLSYGQPFDGSTQGDLVVVMPRIGTVSPWASKATDIARNCGLAVRRLERVVHYRLQFGLLGTLLGQSPGRVEMAKLADALHDRMTESVVFEADAAAALFTALHPAPLETIDLLGGGPRCLRGRQYPLWPGAGRRRNALPAAVFRRIGAQPNRR